jgi:sigma-B regulation protein RsbU (phosphoserine phosphatase)
MFRLRSVPARVAAAIAVPLLFCWPLPLIRQPDDLRLGPVLVLAVVAVAAVAGWQATVLAGAIVVASYWYYGVPYERSFHFDEGRSAIAVVAMAALVVGIALMARRVEQSVEDVRALDAQRRDRALVEARLRRGAELAAGQMQALLRLSTALAGAGSVAQVAQVTVNEISLPAWPTTASVALVRDRHLQVLTARGADQRSLRVLESVDLSTSSWLGDALDGTPVVVDDRDSFAREHPDALVLQFYPSGSWAVFPFHSVSTRGLLSLYYVGPQRLSEHVEYFRVASEILSSALERAQAEELQQEQLVHLEQAFAERDRIARTLSTTLLPPSLPQLPGFTAAGWVIPAHAGEVAGDFYDLFPVAGGDWVAVVGDVCGKGAEAAAVTSLARYAARVTALADPDPAHIAEVANAALIEDPSDLFCTMGVVRCHADGALEVTLAGHPQPRVVQPGPEGSKVIRVGRFGTVLGYATRSPVVVRASLPPGASLVLHSDGITERDPSFGEDELDQLLAAAPPGPAAALADHVRTGILRIPARRHDDLTLLVITRDP